MEVGINEKRLAPVGCDGEELGATRHVGPTVIGHDGIIPPRNGAGTRPTLAGCYQIPGARAPQKATRPKAPRTRSRLTSSRWIRPGATVHCPDSSRTLFLGSPQGCLDQQPARLCLGRSGLPIPLNGDVWMDPSKL